MRPFQQFLHYWCRVLECWYHYYTIVFFFLSFSLSLRKMGNCVSLDISCDQTLNHACGCLFGDGNYIHKMEANLKALEKAMQELEERRDDLLRRVVIEEDKGLQRLSQVQGWFSRVQCVGSQVNDLLEAKSTEAKRLCLFSYCSKKCITSCNYGKKVLNMLKEVEGLLAKGVFEVVAEKDISQTLLLSLTMSFPLVCILDIK